MDKMDECAIVSILLSLSVYMLIFLFIVMLKDLITFETNKIKRCITFIPRLFIRGFKIKHKHNYIFYDCGGGDLSGSFSIYKCIWCGDEIHKL